MKIHLSLLFSAGTAWLAGCATAPKFYSDYVVGTDYAHYKTFAIIKRIGMSSATVVGPTLIARVRAAVTQSLSAKGFASVDESRADFLVIVHGRIDQRFDVRTFGYTLPGQPWHGGGFWGAGWGGPMWTNETTVSNIGRLAVDIVDGKSKELVWRGVAKKENVDEQPDPDRIAAVIAQILTAFPPPAATPAEKRTPH